LKEGGEDTEGKVYSNIQRGPNLCVGGGGALEGFIGGGEAGLGKTNELKN